VKLVHLVGFVIYIDIFHTVVPSGYYLLIVRTTNYILKLFYQLSHMYIMVNDDMFRSDSTIFRSLRAMYPATYS